MLYVGPVVLKGILDERRFKHFMLFHTAMYILASQSCVTEDWINYAGSLLDIFNRDFAEAYDKDCMIFNVHMLTHLHNDARIYGSIDNFNAFPFENHMQALKRTLRTKNFHLAQLVKRIYEREFLPFEYPRTSFNLIVNKSEKDNCYITNESKICVLKEIDCVSIKICYFKLQNNVEWYPILSSVLGIYFVEELQELVVVKNRIVLVKKCMQIPFENGFICIPFKSEGLL